ncbi:MAG: hypothetical protein HDQ95_01560 [Roseburia sp.]|nr:hypothetical protein [Roseburia sp.]
MTEYDKVGEMLLELIAECPHVPQSVKNVPQGMGILIDSTGTGLGIFILTDGGRVKKRNVIGGFEAVINMQIAYQSKADTNSKRINAQETANKITGWLGDLENLPKLTGNRTITKFEASGSYASRDSTTQDGYVAFAADVVMEYEVD